MPPASPRSLRDAKCRFAYKTSLLLSADSHADIQREPQITVAVQLRPVGVFVIVRGRAPTFGDGQILVRHFVTVGVSESRQFAALNGIEGIAVLQQPERFVQRGSELFASHVLRRVLVNAVQQPDFTFANRNGKSPIIDDRETTHFQC